jgi:hypothetical protein
MILFASAFKKLMIFLFFWKGGGGFVSQANNTEKQATTKVEKPRCLNPENY